MPLALETDATFRVVLESDKGKPKDEQPYFEFRHISGSEWFKYIKEGATLGDCKDEIGALRKSYDIAAKYLVGWGNMKKPNGTVIRFNKKRLDTVIGIEELQELIFKVRNQGLLVEDRKNSESSQG